MCLCGYWRLVAEEIWPEFRAIRVLYTFFWRSVISCLGACATLDAGVTGVLLCHAIHSVTPFLLCRACITLDAGVGRHGVTEYDATLLRGNEYVMVSRMANQSINPIQSNQLHVK